MKKILKILLATVFSMTASFLAAADNNPTREATRFNHAINLNPIGFITGSYGGNYELLLAQTHGLVFEGAYSNTKATSGSDEATAKGGTGAFHYRWHWSNAMESGFLGAFVRYSSATGTGNVTTTSGTTITKTNFDVTLTATTIGLNIGKRWVWDNGINIVARIGYGYSNLNLSTTSTDSNVNKTLSDLKPILQVISGLDAELSVGYAF